MQASGLFITYLLNIYHFIINHYLFILVLSITDLHLFEALCIYFLIKIIYEYHLYEKTETKRTMDLTQIGQLFSDKGQSKELLKEFLPHTRFFTISSGHFLYFLVTHSIKTC